MWCVQSTLRIIEDRRPLIDDFTSTGQELIDMYSPEEGQTVHDDVVAVTSKYHEVKQATRDKVHRLTDTLRPTLTDVSWITLNFDHSFKCSLIAHAWTDRGSYRITKLSMEMLHNESWKPIDFGVKRSNVKVTRRKKFVSVFRRNTLLPLAACISYDTGFSLRHLSAAKDAANHRFFSCVKFFTVSQLQKHFRRGL